MKTSNHLRYNLYGAPDGHPQKVMKTLGITYQHATPQLLGDQWWFWNCENIPPVIPTNITELNLNPYECIGYGLSPEDARKISGREPNSEERKIIDKFERSIRKNRS